jgi:hypothetical protein
VRSLFIKGKQVTIGFVEVVSSATTSSRGPVTIPWSTVNNPNALNGTHTLGASIRDASGKTGSTSITVIVNNP